jgi:hypothetical protein
LLDGLARLIVYQLVVFAGGGNLRFVFCLFRRVLLCLSFFGVIRINQRLQLLRPLLFLLLQAIAVD